MSDLQKITEEQMDAVGVCSAPDVLSGSTSENKAVFDKMVRQLVAPAYNAAVDAIEAINQTETGVEAAEAKRAAAEAGRVEAEAGRVDAEAARVRAEQDRQEAEQARSNEESTRQKAENARKEAEQSRMDAETARRQAEQQRVDSTTGIVARATGQAQAARDSAVLAQSWAVGETGTREGENTDNAQYWAQQAHMAAGGGVVSFNGRTGSVMPQKGDYTAADVGAAPDGFGLGTKCTNVESLDTINVNGWYAFIGDIAPDNAGWWVAFYTMSGSMGNLLAFKNGFIAQKKKYYDTWGDWEWLNPPMQIEVEYRTTERFNGKPVYRKLINFGQLPNNSTKTVFISDESVNLLSAFGYQYNSNQIIPNGCYGGDASKQVLVGGNGQNLIIATNFTPNETNAYIEVKYTKTAD